MSDKLFKVIEDLQSDKSSGLTQLNAQNPVVRRFIAAPTPDKSGNYNRNSIEKPIVNNDRCSLLKCVSPNMLLFTFNQYTQA